MSIGRFSLCTTSAVITVILNPAAGGHRGGDDAEVAKAFADARVPVRIVSCLSAVDAAAAAHAASKSRAEVVVAVGGDGTVSTVAAGLAGSETPLGVLPRGTLNHFAKDAGIPLDLASAVKTIAEGRTRNVDVGEVNGRIFLNNVSLGIYPDVVVERESLRRQGYGKWTAFGVATARIMRTHRGLVLRITAGKSSDVARTPFLLVGNNEYEREGIHLGERKSLEGGRLFAYFAPRLRGRELPKLFVLALLNQERKRQALESLAVCALRAETTAARRDLRVAIDGEVVMMTAPLDFHVRPRALRVIVPQG
jgi:diacylglycerol kinase family enzyme